MVQFYDHITESLRDWILKQKLFWVATAPLTAEGHVNLSTKGGYGTFHIIDENTVWYEDLTGSGVETIAHLRENGRITVLFNAFEGPPRILRMFGKGTVHEFGSPEYNKLLPENARTPGSRSVIMISVYKVSTSCGYVVPFFDYRGERGSQHHNLAVKLEAIDMASQASSEPASGGLKWYWQTQNAKSLDELPGVPEGAYQSMRQFVDEASTSRSLRPRKCNTKVGGPIERFKPMGQTVLAVSLAFVAGVALSAPLCNTIERLGLSIL